MSTQIIRIGTLVLVTACGLLAAGCDSRQSDKGASASVGVVDVDRVATEIGLNAKYQESVTAYRDKLRKNLEEVLLPMQKDLERLREELRRKVDAIPEADRRKPDFKAPLEVEDSYRRVAAKQQQIQAEAQAREARLQEYDRKMKQDFQLAIQPALSAVAGAKGVQMIVPRGASLYVAPDLDMTNLVIAHLKTHSISLPTAPSE